MSDNDNDEVYQIFGGVPDVLGLQTEKSELPANLVDHLASSNNSDVVGVFGGGYETFISGLIAFEENDNDDNDDSNEEPPSDTKGASDNNVTQLPIYAELEHDSSVQIDDPDMDSYDKIVDGDSNTDNVNESPFITGGDDESDSDDSDTKSDTKSELPFIEEENDDENDEEDPDNNDDNDVYVYESDNETDKPDKKSKEHTSEHTSEHPTQDSDEETKDVDDSHKKRADNVEIIELSDDVVYKKTGGVESDIFSALSSYITDIST
jgi:hypothetical protein